jgi:diadenosine tetraphosphatase ApaH/serine/threonine PP2A family protein phosphatase
MKYDDLTFSMVSEVFRFLPLIHIIDEQVFVIHGGLFGRRGVTLQDLAEIDRLDYSPAPPPEPDPTSPEDEIQQDRRQLMRDALWSDPKAERGLKFNHARRQGQLFGPDITKEFLETNNLSMVVRSHECVRNGWDLPYAADPHLLATVFSASGYSGSNNKGAYLSFSRAEDAGSILVGGTNEDRRGAAGERAPLFFCAHEFTMVEAEGSLEQANKTSIRSLILHKRQELLDAFELLDVEKKGLVTEEDWATTLGTVTGFVIDWKQVIGYLIFCYCSKNRPSPTHLLQFNPSSTLAD